MSNPSELNGSCDEVTSSIHQSHSEDCSDNGMLEVEEGRPPWLNTIIHSLEGTSKGHILRDDYFVALLYVLVHEVGFTVPGGQENPSCCFDVRILRGLANLTQVEKKEFSYHVPLVLHNCSIPCDLVIVPHGNICIVNFHIPSVETYSVSFNVNKYVTINSKNSPEFHNLNDLARSFKEACHKFRNALLDTCDLPSQHITKIPYEVLVHICTYLDPVSFVHFSTCCKKYHDSLYHDECIWKRLFKSNFKTDSVPSKSCTWKKHFIDESKNKSLSQRYFRCETMHVLPTLSPHFHFMRSGNLR